MKISGKMNIIIIGDGEVGKTSILKFFDKRKAPSAHIRTVGVDYISHNTEREGNSIQVKLWDTAG
jgi:small GTP-binding protein